MSIAQNYWSIITVLWKSHDLLIIQKIATNPPYLSRTNVFPHSRVPSSSTFPHAPTPAPPHSIPPAEHSLHAIWAARHGRLNTQTRRPRSSSPKLSFLSVLQGVAPGRPSPRPPWPLGQRPLLLISPEMTWQLPSPPEGPLRRSVQSKQAVWPCCRSKQARNVGAIVGRGVSPLRGARCTGGELQGWGVYTGMGNNTQGCGSVVSMDPIPRCMDTILVKCLVTVVSQYVESAGIWESALCHVEWGIMERWAQGTLWS